MIFFEISITMMVIRKSFNKCTNYVTCVWNTFLDYTKNELSIGILDDKFPFVFSTISLKLLLSILSNMKYATSYC